MELPGDNPKSEIATYVDGKEKRNETIFKKKFREAEQKKGKTLLRTAKKDDWKRWNWKRHALRRFQKQAAKENYSWELSLLA